MSVRKRVWTTPKGEEKSAWVADYLDAKGTRRLKTFKLKKHADAFAATANVEVREGTHVADSASITVAKAGDMWLASGEANGLERSSIAQRKRHLALHIVPLIGPTLVSKISVPAVRSFEDELRAKGTSAAMVKKLVVSLGSILSDAQERGLAAKNPVRDMKSRRGASGRRAEGRQKSRLTVGEDIPTPDEVRRILEAASGRWRPLLITAVFTGMRASELRGLRWQDIDFDERTVRVRQRADEYGIIGPPKSEAGIRDIPVPPIVVHTLREWRLACPRRATRRTDDTGKAATELHLVFPNGLGKVENYKNILRRGFGPVQIAAGVSVLSGKIDKEGQPILAGKYGGLHALRHFFASWCINRPRDGGLGLPLKVVQERMGHATISMTGDVYGHLFPRADDADEMAAAERALLMPHAT
ncbi:site-specific recombinase XerD [Ancylobacter aquaticus]|uniref:Site-specific recombinase XerD n=1 Tax=Ancylobacter aquaticus TaxID=100 RepID=A0A4R1I5J1_ANCAQ|nr:site-specific integrase [Ancylobacter aquaticus]TCK29005.1 site-specific recombinase XerD [Ancylobacter aquaticus]